jgi:hypothetical protein
MKEQIQKHVRKHIKGGCYLKVTLGLRGLTDQTTNQSHGAESFMKTPSGQEILHHLMELDSLFSYFKKPATLSNPEPE